MTLMTAPSVAGAQSSSESRTLHGGREIRVVRNRSPAYAVFMVPCRFTVAALALLAALAATAVPAQPTSHEDPVRLYTNADLEQLDALPGAAKPDAQADDSGWEFVADFIAREHERLDAERSHELNLRLVDIEEEESDDRRQRLGIGYGYPFVYAHPHSAGVRKRSGPGGHIVPLHARPSPAQVQRSMAIQRSGRDAFPSRSGPSH